MAITRAEKDRRYYLKHGAEKNRKTKEKYAENELFRERKKERFRKYYAENLEFCQRKRRALKERYRATGRCSSCGRPLSQGENKTCVNCGSTIKSEFKYAEDCKRLAAVI
jgi:hypothetical protein